MLPPDARRTFLPSLALSLSLLTLAGCGGDKGTVTPPEVPAALGLVSGGGALSGTVGNALAEPIAVRVTSAKGKALSDVKVTFQPFGKGASVSTTTVTTNADGVAATTWTLGTIARANSDTLLATVGALPNAPVRVVATATAGAPGQITKYAGDVQTGILGQSLAEPLVVAVGDQFGNRLAGVTVSWTVEGGGTLSASTTTSDANGLASVAWTLGTGPNRAHAAISAGPSTTFIAGVSGTGAVTVTAVSPAELREGQSATLTGTGFSTTATENLVLIDGRQAVVTAATSTSLQITVPTFDCRPARDVMIQVATGGDISEWLWRWLKPAQASLNLAVGEQLILRNPADFCVQFGKWGEAEGYLLGVQSVSASAASMTPAVLATGASSFGSGPDTYAAARTSPLPPALRRAASGSVVPSIVMGDDRWALHRAAESALRTRERQLLAPRMREAAAARRRAASTGISMAVAPTAMVGDTVQIRFPDLNAGDFCTNFVPITTVVRAMGNKGIWLEDVANPAGGYTVADFQSMSDMFDNTIYATAADYFGEPTDFDTNGRVVVVTSKEVNRVQSVLGFVVSSDLYPRTYCASSNNGEFYYGRAPDPTGAYAKPAPYTLDRARLDAPFLIAHEFSHVIQFGRRLTYPGMTAFQTAWEAEGQATFAEEVVGHRFTGRSSRQNYGANVVFNDPAVSNIDWYSNRFGDLASYFGFQTRTSRAPNAPEQCSWLGRKGDGNDGPCLGGRDVYGVPALFLRWITDQYGPTFPGGEQGLHRALIDNSRSGFETISDVLGTPMDSLLAQFAAALYVDDKVPGANPRLTFASWNLADIFDNVVPTAQLAPRERYFGSDIADAVTVRGGSTAYFRLVGYTYPTAVRVRDAADAPLPSHMRFWIVRIF